LIKPPLLARFQGSPPPRFRMDAFQYRLAILKAATAFVRVADG
jgi:hypothetical protein